MGRTDDNSGLRPGHGKYALGSIARQRFDVTLLSRWPCNEAAIARSEAVELKVVDTEPSMKGATAAAQYKPAKLETGLKITVPPFIGVGEVVQIDTRTGEYLGRAK